MERLGLLEMIIGIIWEREKEREREREVNFNEKKDNVIIGGKIGFGLRDADKTWLKITSILYVIQVFLIDLLF